MREIKFRGVRIDNNEIIYGSLIKDSDFHYRIVVVDNTKPYDWYAVIPESVGQFTGLRDDNDEEIFEGDIMNVELPAGGFWGESTQVKTGAVIYEPEQGGFIVQWEYSKNQHHVLLDCYIAFTGQVIGNIYQNPNLTDHL